MFVTGDTLAPRTLQFLEKSGLPYLSKPFLVEELKLAVSRRLERNRNAAQTAGALGAQEANHEPEIVSHMPTQMQERKAMAPCRTLIGIADAGLAARLARESKVTVRRSPCGSRGAFRIWST